jgi:HAD superfamily hydrolase (TIGR01509 family)
MSEAEKAVLFDVDGTLVDTNYLHAVTWWQAFAQAGHQVPMTDIHRAVGMGSDQLLDALLPAGRDKSADDDIRAAHGTLYAPYWPHIRPFEGAADLLRACRAAGPQVILASSADPAEFAALRAALDAEDAITAATSAADVEQSKPAPDLVQVALDKAGVRAEEAIFVGDTVWDVRACQRAGVRCVALLSGGISAAELHEAGAVTVFRDPADLLASTGGRIAAALSRPRDPVGTPG